MALVDEEGQLAIVGQSVGHWLDEDDFVFSGEDHWDDSILEVGSHVFPRDWPDVYDESEALRFLLKKTGPCASKRVSVVPNLGQEHKGLAEGVDLRWLQSLANAERIKQHTGLSIVEGWVIFDLLEDVTGAAFVAERFWWNATKDGEWLDFTPRPENVQQLLLAEALTPRPPKRPVSLTRRQQALAQHLLKRRCPKAVAMAARTARAAGSARGTEAEKLPPLVAPSARSEEVREAVRKVKLGVLEPVYALLKQVPDDADLCEGLVRAGMCAALAGQLCNKKYVVGVVKLLVALTTSAREGGFGRDAADSFVAEDGVELALQLLTSKDSELVANVALALGHVCFRCEPAQTRAGHAGAIGQIVRLLARTEDRVAAEAAYLLWHILVGHKSNITAAFAEGSCRALLGLLSPEAGSQAATNAAGALMQLVAAPGAQDEMAQIGAIPALSLLLQDERMPRARRGPVAGALMNATDCHEANARQALSQGGTLEALVGLLREEGAGAAREYAAGALANLAAFGGPDAPGAAVAAGAVEALLAFLPASGTRDAEVFAALANLSQHIPEDRLSLFEGRLLERLLTPLRDREDPSRQQALGLCMNIALHVPVKLRLVRAGFVKVVVELLEDADEALRELAAGALANLMEGHAETVANVFLQAPDLHKKLVYVLETEYSKVIQKPMARAVALLAGRHREVVRRAGAVEPLCDIVDESSAWEAVLGLMNIAPVGKERHELVKRGTVKALVKLVTEGLGNCRYYAVGALANALAGSAEAATQAIAAGAVPAVAGILREVDDHIAAVKAKAMQEVPPLLRLDGPFSEDHPGDLGEVGPFSAENGQTQPLLGGSFSLSARVKMIGAGEWSRIFDFSVGADCDSITAGSTALPGELHFSVFQGPELAGSLLVPGGLVLGVEATYLFTVSESGRLRIYRDGALLGEKAAGLPPLRLPRPHLRLAGSHHWPEQGFHGTVAAVSVWDQEVEWQASAPWRLLEASQWAAGAVGLLAEYGDHRACAELVEEAGGVLPALVQLLDGARTDVAELAVFALGALAEGREREVYEALEGKKKRLQEVVALLPMGVLRERARFLMRLAR